MRTKTTLAVLAAAALAVSAGGAVAGPGARTIVGTSHNDALVGTSGSDRIRGLAGDDIIQGRADKDQLYGGLGDDRVNGGQGADIVSGRAGNDHLLGRQGPDLILGGALLSGLADRFPRRRVLVLTDLVRRHRALRLQARQCGAVEIVPPRVGCGPRAEEAVGLSLRQGALRRCR